MRIYILITDYQAADIMRFYMGEPIRLTDNGNFIKKAIAWLVRTASIIVAAVAGILYGRQQVFVLLEIMSMISLYVSVMTAIMISARVYSRISNHVILSPDIPFLFSSIFLILYHNFKDPSPLFCKA